MRRNFVDVALAVDRLAPETAGGISDHAEQQHGLFEGRPMFRPRHARALAWLKTYLK